MSLAERSSWKKGDEEDLTEMQDCFCVVCHGSNGVTRLLPTQIPFFREICVVGFHCRDCGHTNSEVQLGGDIQPRGERIRFRVASSNDLSRQIIKSGSCTIHLPHLEFEIPPAAQRGTISTIEGVLGRAVSHLQPLQPERLRLGDLENFRRCQSVIEKLQQIIDTTTTRMGEDTATEPATLPDKGDDGDFTSFPFDFVMDDPSGNSFLENPYAPEKDPEMVVERYHRTAKQDLSLGLEPLRQVVDDGTTPQPTLKDQIGANSKSTTTKHESVEIDTARSMQNEVMKFPTRCPRCQRPSETNMCTTRIPHFKEVVIMSLLCDSCGFRSNEIKAGGAIPEAGQRITLHCRIPEDLCRDVLKSDTAGLAIPELDLELEEGGLGGFYTTVEGLLKKVHSRLKSANPFSTGDASIQQHRSNDGDRFSAPNPSHLRFAEFLGRLLDAANGRMFPFRIILSDPLANSFIGPVSNDAAALEQQAENDGDNSCYDNHVDERIELEEYERTDAENEILGLNHMRTENFDKDP